MKAKITHTLILAICILVGAISQSASEMQSSEKKIGKPVWTAENSDPAKFDWMVGFPSPENKIIRFEDGTYFLYPQMRWSVCHFDQPVPTKRVFRGLSSIAIFEREEIDGLDQLTFMPLDGTVPMTWAESLTENFTDGILVLHRGRIVYDRYSGALKPSGRHAAMSVNKSVVGVLGELLIGEGRLNEYKLVREYIWISKSAEQTLGDLFQIGHTQYIVPVQLIVAA